MELNNSFIHKYVGNTDSDYIVVYIYLYSAHTCNFNLSEVCERLNITSKTLIEALKFWTEQHLLSYSCKQERLRVIFAKSESVHETSIQYLEKLKANEEFCQIIQLIKKHLKIENRDYPKIAYIYSEYNYTHDMFVALLKYATDHHAASVQYLIQLAEKWHDSEVDTISKAVDWIQGNYNTYYQYMQIIGANHYPTDTERQLLKTWQQSYSDDEIKDALILSSINCKSGSYYKYADQVLRRAHSNKSAE